MLIDKFINFALTHKNKLLFLATAMLTIVMTDSPPNGRFG